MIDVDGRRRGAVEDCAAEIVAAYVSNNHVSRGDLPALIASVRATLARMANGGREQRAEPNEKATDTQIRKSITPDALVSFIDGKLYKTLKRHLTANGLDPYSYRVRYGLPNDYPMVASTYGARRSAITHGINLKRRKQSLRQNAE